MNYQTQYFINIWTQAAWIAGSLFWFWQRRDELPLVISAFLFYVFSFRFWTLVNGYSAPVDISPFGFESMTFDRGAEAQSIAVWGESVLLATYMFSQKATLATSVLLAPERFIKWLRPTVFVFSGVAILITLAARYQTGAQLDAGKSMAFEVSAYLYELPLMLISVAILLALLWKCGGFENTFQHCLALLIIGVVAVLTFGPTGRFLFLGWVLAVTIVISTGDSMGRRVAKISIGFAIALILFGVAGALRTTDEDADLQKDTWERLFFAEDANMLDGMALLRQVYPDRLPFTYGGEHLEILERPIPRALWPDKPVGGYMNKLGLTSVGTGFTLGISPSLLGSFYSEGGMPGVVIFSLLYGWGLGRLINYSTEVKPFAGALVRAICCASVIPLLRGGDLPGIYAWIFMAFWPCFLLIWMWRRELFAKQTGSVPRGWRRFAGIKRMSAGARPALRRT